MRKFLLIPWLFGITSAFAQVDSCLSVVVINGKEFACVIPPVYLKQKMALNNVNNTSDAGKPISDATQTALNLKAPLVSPTFTGTVTLPNGTVTNVMLAGSIDATTKLTGVLPFAQGGISGAAATPATTGAMTINMTASVITVTPTGACTFNASGGVAGQIVTFSITTSGVTSFVLTFGSNFRKTGTLATGTTTARFFTVSFVCIDGVIWSELSRTAAQS